MVCEVTTGNLDHNTLIFYITFGLVIAIGALFSTTGRTILRHLAWLIFVALAIGVHRWLPQFPPVLWLRNSERYFGPDTPVLIEHFVTGVICVWSASIAVRPAPWLAAKTADIYQKRSLPIGLASVVLSGIPMMLWMYRKQADQLVLLWLPFALTSGALIFTAITPSQTFSWVSRYQREVLVILALLLWITLCLTFGVCQYQTRNAVVVSNANHQLLTSFSAFLLTVVLRLKWNIFA